MDPDIYEGYYYSPPSKRPLCIYLSTHGHWGQQSPVQIVSADSRAAHRMVIDGNRDGMVIDGDLIDSDEDGIVIDSDGGGMVIVGDEDGTVMESDGDGEDFPQVFKKFMTTGLSWMQGKDYSGAPFWVVWSPDDTTTFNTFCE